MKKHISPVVICWIIILLSITCLGILSGCSRLSPVAGESLNIYQGVHYSREVRTTPRRMVIHVVKVDLREKGIGLFVTPGSPGAAYPLKAMSTSAFAQKYQVQIAINGDAFSPWHANTLLDYYPHSGDGVAPTGFAASAGIAYSQDTDEEPTLYIARTNQAQFENQLGNLYHAISGTDMLVRSGSIVPGLSGAPEPRTAVALTRSNKELLLFVVDGRQQGYSEGATLTELAGIILEYGGVNAMNLDGGGSSTLVMQKADGRYRVINSPIHNDIPGRERIVGNHLGIYAQKANEELKDESTGAKKQPKIKTEQE